MKSLIIGQALRVLARIADLDAKMFKINIDIILKGGRGRELLIIQTTKPPSPTFVRIDGSGEVTQQLRLRMTSFRVSASRSTSTFSSPENLGRF